MKKQKSICAAVACAAAVVGTGLVIGGGSVSAADHEYIYFKTRTAGTEQTVICAFYDNVETSYSYDACDSSYGSYNATSKTLTLGAGINDLPNGRVEIGIDGVSVTASSNIRSAIYASLVEGVTLDFGSYSFTDTLYKATDSLDDSQSNFGSNPTIKSGTLTLYPISLFSSLDIEGGTININSNSTVAISTVGDLNISGGVINIPSSNIALRANEGNLNITGGKINAEDIKTTGLSVAGNTNISGGEINLKSSKEPAGFGALLGRGKNLVIDGGNLTLDGFMWGISGTNSKIYFNGGTTVIKNSKTHTIWIQPAADPENDIVFGDGMGIKGDTYVFYGDTSEGTGIADPDEVTITKGYTYRKHYGWENIDGEVDIDEDEPEVKVPDTGVFSGSNNGVMAAAISLGAVVALTMGAVTVYFIVRRHNGNIKFQKKQF